MRRLVRWLAVALILGVAAGYAIVNFSGHDAERWHVDLAVTELRGAPNEFLAAPPEATAAEPHMRTGSYDESPRELLERFDAIVREEPRTEVVAGSVDSLMITYVQRTEIVGFPDYVTVKAVPAEEGASLIVWSRSRYGADDFGVNEARVRRWLAELGER